MLNIKKLLVALAAVLVHQVAVAQFPAEINLSDLNGDNGFIINGEAEDDSSGRSVSGAGDVNGDGIDDVIIGARDADPGGNSRAGRSYVVFGSDTGFPNVFDLTDLNGSNGFKINGESEVDQSGVSVDTAGDVNGDGIADVIIGANGADPSGVSNAGSSYVVFGSDTGFPNVFDLSDLNGSNGFKFNSEGVFDSSGRSVSAAGDVNGDGMDDVIIGAGGADTGGQSSTGSSYVLFGSDTGFPNPFNLTDLDGTNGFKINGEVANDRSGSSVSAAGDVNGDGIADVIIGAQNADPSGESGAGSSYVVFGSDTGFSNPFNLTDLNGLNGFKINGEIENDFSGVSVSGMGDVNGDGIDDVIIGAEGADPGGESVAGSSYVVFGSDTGFPNPLKLSDLDGTNGFKINGEVASDRLGKSVSAAGDVNGDGIADVIVGAYSADPGGESDAGASYVVFGSDTGFPNPLNLSDLDGTNGFKINGESAGDQSGYSVSAAGDVNGDGMDDVIIGARNADPGGEPGAGRSYVMFGNDTIFKNGFE